LGGFQEEQEENKKYDLPLPWQRNTAFLQTIIPYRNIKKMEKKAIANEKSNSSTCHF